VDVAGSLPVTRSNLMNRAEKIVDALLEDEGPKAFLGRHDDLVAAMVLAQVREAGADLNDVDGVEVYGVAVDPEGNQERSEPAGSRQAKFWSVSIHTENPDNWMIDYDDYKSPQQAIAAAKELHKILSDAMPDRTIHFINEISPA
jgi:hypothetical protein